MKFQILQLILIQLGNFIAAIGVAGSKVITFEKMLVVFYVSSRCALGMSFETSSVCLNDFFFDSLWFNNVTVSAVFRSKRSEIDKKKFYNEKHY